MLNNFLLLCSALFFLNGLNAQENYNLVVRSNLPFPGLSLANIGGYVDSSGNEYALVGTSRGLTIVNVSNPEQPFVRFTVNGVQNNWREVKTWNGFAYVTSEGANSGLTIIDMRELPDTIFTKVYRGDGAINNQLSSNHALHIDAGFCYLYGTNAFAPPNLNSGGVIALNLQDPWNPKYAGKYSEIYVHDGFVNNDTLWGCNVYDGVFTVVDFRNKANPVSIAQQETPGGVTHNSWLTDDRRTLLVTDESTNSFLTSWDITNLSNITELDRYQTAPGSNSIVHNTHVLNDFAVTSWYTEGVVIVDASRPQNLVEVAKNDFTVLEGDGFNGCWGVYPYLPSGNLVASDMEKGLYVLTPTYVRASYLEGIVRDSACGGLLDQVNVQIVGTDRKDRTGIDGIFRTGTAAPGTYNVTFSRSGYPSKTLQNIVLQSGQVTNLEVELYSPDNIAVTGIIESLPGEPLDNAQINLRSNSNNFMLNTNSNGEFAKCNLVPGSYDFAAGKWGFVTNCEQIDINTASELEKQLEPGYFDDFQFNFGWQTGGSAIVGKWVRAIPFGTSYNGAASNPSTDVSGDCNSFAFVTGNASNSSAGTDDVDDGNTILRSPDMDLSSYSDPYVHVYRWFYNGGGANPFSNDANDTLFLKLQQGSETITLKKITRNSGMSAWVKESFRIRDFISNPGIVQFIAEAEDFEPGHLVEAGIDQFSVVDSGTTVNQQKIESAFKASIHPNPSGSDATLNFDPDKNLVLLTISDISGKIVHAQNLSGNKSVINLPARFPQGIYFLRLSNTQGQFEILRWIKQ